jgi:hypothetical protein
MTHGAISRPGGVGMLCTAPPRYRGHARYTCMRRDGKQTRPRQGPKEREQMQWSPSDMPAPTCSYSLLSAKHCPESSLKLLSVDTHCAFCRVCPHCNEEQHTNTDAGPPWHQLARLQSFGSGARANRADDERARLSDAKSRVLATCTTKPEKARRLAHEATHNT